MRIRRAPPIALVLLSFSAPYASASTPTPLWQRFPLTQQSREHRATPDRTTHAAVKGPADPSGPAWLLALLAAPAAVLVVTAIRRGWTDSSTGRDFPGSRVDTTKLAFVVIASVVGLAIGFLIPFLS